MEEEIEYEGSYIICLRSTVLEPGLNSVVAPLLLLLTTPPYHLSILRIFKRSLYFGKDVFGQTLGVSVWTGDCSGLPILRHKHH